MPNTKRHIKNKKLLPKTTTKLIQPTLSKIWKTKLSSDTEQQHKNTTALYNTTIIDDSNSGQKSNDKRTTHSKPSNHSQSSTNNIESFNYISIDTTQRTISDSRQEETDLSKTLEKVKQTHTDHLKNFEFKESVRNDSLTYSLKDSSSYKFGPRPSSTYTRTCAADALPSEEQNNRRKKSLHQHLNNNTIKEHKNFHQIKLKPMHTSNLPFGDDIMEDTNYDTILFHNMNGIKEETNWHQISKTMAELKVSLFGFAEINQTLRHGAQNKWVQVTRKFFAHSKMTYSESDISMNSYKPGGTMTTITGKWQARVSEKSCDDTGLGRWSYFKVSSNRKAIIIITAYRPCASHGPSTAWMQQWLLLRESGETDPDPIKKFYNDLEKLIQGWINQNIEVILLLDANETIGERPGGLSSVVG
jgi:hypothetical protein